MQMQIVDTVKNLFARNPGFTAILGRNTVDEVEYDFSQSDLEQNEIDVPTKRDLPKQGKASVQYRTLDDMNIWSWVSGKYIEYNPYNYGITQQYNENKPAVLVPSDIGVDEVTDRPIFEDSFQLAAISIEQIRQGADARLAVGYNIDAFREDIRMITQLKIPFASMVSEKKDRPYFGKDEKQNTLDNWFIQNHTALHLLLRSSCRSAEHYDKNMLDGINVKGAHLWWDNTSNRAKFKDGEFVVNL